MVYNLDSGGPPEDKWWKYALGGICAGTGIAGAYYSSNLDKEVNPTNLLNFFFTVGPAIIPVFGTEGGAVGDMTLSYFTQNGFKTTATRVPGKKHYYYHLTGHGQPEK